MSAGKSRQSHYQHHNAAATSAVARVDVRRARVRFAGARTYVGAAPGCRAIWPAAAGAETQGDRAR